MNKYNRRSRPNLRHVCEFWTPSTVVTASGELTQEFTLHYRGPFSMEVPRSPNEITDSGRSQSEQVFYLIGQWCSSAASITAGMFCHSSSPESLCGLGTSNRPMGRQS